MSKAGLGKLLPFGSKLRDKKYRSQLSVFLICLLIASFVWLIIKLSKEYTYTVFWPVEYSNLPRGQVLALKGDTALRFQIKARGFDLLPTYLAGPSKTVNVDLEGLRYMKDKGRLRNAYLLADELKVTVANQLRLNERLVSIEPDTIFFQLSPLHSKRLPVVVELDYQTEQSYALYGNITIEPDTIRVEGPGAYVDTLKFIKLKKVVAGTLTKNHHTKTGIAARYKSMPLQFSRTNVDITIPIEKFTEATVLVPLVTTDSCHLKFFPEKVSILCQVALRDYKKLDANMFVAEVSCADALSSNRSIIEPYVKSFPPFVKVLRTDPQQVEFIILK